MYSTEINGQTTEFGTSGMLFRSNKLMYDRVTETLWHQFLGVPVVGPLANSGIRLEVIPNVLTTWGQWLEQHPDTTVISDETGVYPAETYLPEDNPRSIYFSYRAARGTMFPVAGIEESLPIKQQIFGLTFGEEARAYPREVLAQTPLLNDNLGGQDVVIVTVTGGGSRAFDGQGLDFEFSDDGHIQSSDGRTWRIFENALENTADPSDRLTRLPSRDAYWFGWQAFYPHTDFYSP